MFFARLLSAVKQEWKNVDSENDVQSFAKLFLFMNGLSLSLSFASLNRLCWMQTRTIRSEGVSRDDLNYLYFQNLGKVPKMVIEK